MFKNFWNDESGQGMVEYVLIIALIAVAAVLAFQGLSEKLNGMLDTVGDSL